MHYPHSCTTSLFAISPLSRHVMNIYKLVCCTNTSAHGLGTAKRNFDLADLWRNYQFYEDSIELIATCKKCMSEGSLSSLHSVVTIIHSCTV